MNALDLLTAATRAIPVTAPARHSLTLDDAGGLRLTVFVGEKWYAFGLDAADMLKAPAELVAECAAHLVDARPRL